MVIIYSGLLLIGVWSYTAHLSRVDRGLTTTAAENGLLATSNALALDVQAMMGDGVGAALAAANVLDGPPARARADASIVLKQMLTGGEYVRAVFLLDAHGYTEVTRVGAQATPSPPPWLQSALQANPGAAWVGAPIPSPEDRARRVIPVARRRGDTIAGALFDFDQLATTYTPQTPGGGVMLFSAAGIALEGLPLKRYAAYVGLDYSKLGAVRDAVNYVQRSPASSGLVHTNSVLTGEPIAAAFSRVGDYPLITVAAEPTASILAPWQERRVPTESLAITLSLIILAAAALISYFAEAFLGREHQYQALFNNASFGALLLNDDRIVAANPTCAHLYGVETAAELHGLCLWDLSPTEQPGGQLSLPTVRNRLAQARQDGDARFEWTFASRTDGAPFSAEVNLSSFSSRGGTATLAVIQDVSKRNRLERERDQMLHQLQQVAGSLVRLQDEEHRRMGQDLLASAGQTLVALELGLARAQSHGMSLPGGTRALLEECLALARGCSGEVRTASYLMHPPLLDEVGLLSALRWLADSLDRQSDLRCRLDLPEIWQRQSREAELALFRVAQEAVALLQECDSRSVVIRLRLREDAVRLHVRTGESDRISAPEQPTSVAGVRLAAMRERLRQLGGNLRLRSAPNGTSIIAEISPSPEDAAGPAADAAGPAARREQHEARQGTDC